MMSKTEVLLFQEISDVTTELIGFNLSIDQNFPSLRAKEDCQVIDWGKSENLSVVFKNIDYVTIYDELENDRNYNIKMIDGALIQLMYKVQQSQLISHRLAFFPNPRLENFQNDPEIYEKEDLFADILSKSILPVSIRFDYNDDVHDEYHAKSHASFGQYKNCRIPVSAPLSPTAFIDFILRNFYSNAYRRFDKLILSKLQINRTITSDEEQFMHFNMIP